MSRRRERQVNEASPWSVRTASVGDEADCDQNAAEIMELLRLNIDLLESLLGSRNDQSNLEHTTYQTVAGSSRVEGLASSQGTSDMEKEQMRRDLRTAEEKVHRHEAEVNKLEAEVKSLEAEVKSLEEELIISRKLLHVKMADAVSELKIRELVDRQNRLHEIQMEQNVSDESSSESDDGDITPHESLCRQLNVSRCNSDYESVERAEGRFTIEGPSSGSSGAASTCGNCEEGTASSTSVPSAATVEDGGTGPEPVKCPICLREFTTQEVCTPESCNHTFCVHCLQEWSENSNTCPVDRGVYRAILVRVYLGGEVVRRIRVESRRLQVGDQVPQYMDYCEECGGGTDIEYGLLYCDECGQGYHLECVYPPLVTFPRPMEDWFCSNCSVPPPLYVYQE
jgi:hypothetical protein